MSEPGAERVLIVDDQPDDVELVTQALSEGCPGWWDITVARSAEEGLSRVRRGPFALILLDYHLPGQSGLTLLSKVRELQPDLPVIIMTAYSDLDSAVSAFQGGAFEYLPKPFDIEKAVELILRAVRESQTEEFVEEADSSAPEILGQAPAMQEVFRAIGRLSQSNVTVLITGES
ncbi:MAG: response regulator, partial [Gaiellales bacterium]